MISVFEGDVYKDPDDGENVMLAEIPWEFKPKRSQRDVLDMFVQAGRGLAAARDRKHRGGEPGADDGGDDSVHGTTPVRLTDQDDYG